MNTDRWAWLRKVDGAVLPPEPIDRTKRRKRRTEAAVKREIRALVAERDPMCRWEGMAPTVCRGRAEWCHLRPRTRAQTRGMDPEYRHTTLFTLMGCKGHHKLYDAGVFETVFLTDRMADGPIEVTRRSRGGS